MAELAALPQPTRGCFRKRSFPSEEYLNHSLKAGWGGSGHLLQPLKGRAWWVNTRQLSLLLHGKHHPGLAWQRQQIEPEQQIPGAPSSTLLWLSQNTPAALRLLSHLLSHCCHLSRADLLQGAFRGWASLLGAGGEKQRCKHCSRGAIIFLHTWHCPGEPSHAGSACVPRSCQLNAASGERKRRLHSTS